MGFKTGEGFYDWQIKDMQALAAKRDKFIMKAVRIIRELDKESNKDVKNTLSHCKALPINLFPLQICASTWSALLQILT